VGVSSLKGSERQMPIIAIPPFWPGLWPDLGPD